MKNANYDAVIIGFGKGGKTLAGKLAKAGKQVALIEKDKGMYGGTCINVGCIPSKSLIHSASQIHNSIEFKDGLIEYKNAVEEKRKLTIMLRKKNYDKLASLPNVTIYDGLARFIGPLEIEVIMNEETVKLTGKQIFINTGSISRVPVIEGIDKVKGVYTSSELMDLDTLPNKLTIIGGGYIGLEFASLYSRFGSKVTVIQDGPNFLPKEDEDIAMETKSILENQGIQFFLNAKIQKLIDGPTVVFEKDSVIHELESDAVLVATGRIPNTNDLNCEAAGVELTSRGAIKVDEQLKTTAENIWAMGDVTGGAQHTYISLDDSRIVWGQLSNTQTHTTVGRNNIPYSVFIATPYSRVGMNEKEARDVGLNIKVAKLPVAAIPKAQVLKAPAGLLKAIINADTNKILGIMLLGEESYETINIVKLAMDLDADYTILRDQIFTHPTMSEALNDLFSI